MSHLEESEETPRPLPFDPRPVKRRRIGNPQHQGIDAIYGPISEGWTTRSHSPISLTAENEQLVHKISTFFKVALSERNDVPAHQFRYLAEHENVAGDEVTRTRTTAVNRLRNTVPELLAYNNVCFDYRHNYWLVDLGSARFRYPVDLPLFVGQCPLQVHGMLGFWIPPTPHHPLDIFINTRSINSDEVCREIHRVFPLSIGMRVLLHGFIEILYVSQKKIRQEVQNSGGFPDQISGFNYHMKVVELQYTTNDNQVFVHARFVPENVELSTPIAAEMNSFETRGCVGLRIRRQLDTADSWTTVTHGFMKNPVNEGLSRAQFWLRNLMANVVTFARLTETWVDKAKSKVGLHWKREITTQHSVAQQLTSTGKRYPKVLGAEVYVAASNVKIGRISHCYDELRLPESTLATPLGLQHDLSLITADEGALLPRMVNIPKHAKPGPKFATPNEILGGESPQAFQAFYHFGVGRRLRATGHFVTGVARDAVIAGAHYWWETSEDSHFHVKRAIIWRTMKDDISMAGGSGGVVCLGHPAAKTCKAAIFQNYESKTMMRNQFWKHDAKLRGFEPCCSFKGGFLLPADVQNATIVFDDADVFEERRNVSGPAGAQPDPYARFPQPQDPKRDPPQAANVRRKLNVTD